jgi:hypothetical protein
VPEHRRVLASAPLFPTVRSTWGCLRYTVSWGPPRALISCISSTGYFPFHGRQLVLPTDLHESDAAGRHLRERAAAGHHHHQHRRPPPLRARRRRPPPPPTPSPVGKGRDFASPSTATFTSTPPPAATSTSAVACREGKGLCLASGMPPTRFTWCRREGRAAGALSPMSSAPQVPATALIPAFSRSPSLLHPETSKDVIKVCSP